MITRYLVSYEIMGQTSQVNALGVLKNTYRRILGVAAVRANARMKLRAV